MTDWNNITTFEQLLTEANAHSPFWTMMLFMIWAVLTISFLPFGTTIAILSGCFLGGLIGIFLVYMGLVAWKWVLMMFALMIGIIIIETLFQRKEN